MEKFKSFETRAIELKNEIINEIRSLLVEGKKVEFTDTFYIHYIEGELATIEVCKSVMMNNQAISLMVKSGIGDEKVTESEMHGYDTDSLLDILKNTKEEVRKQKISHLREIVKNSGGRMKFDGKFDFFIYTWGEDYVCTLDELFVNEKGELHVKNHCDGDKFENHEDEISDTGLDDLISYVEGKTKESFALTDVQTLALEDFIAAARKLSCANVCVIRNEETDDLHFINGERIEEFAVDPKVVPAKDITDIVKNSESLLTICDAAFYFNEEKIFVKMRD